VSTKKCVLVLQLAAVAGLQSTSVFAAANATALPDPPAPSRSQATARPDALLTVDLNRSALVEKIFAAWAREIPSNQGSAIKVKLSGLRADELLAASMASSFDGVLEVLHATEIAGNFQSPAIGSAQSFFATQSALKPAAQNSAFLSKVSEISASDSSKTLGDANADLVYTPVTPCRLFDTRAGLASALGTVGGTFSNQQTKTIAPAGACGIPTSGVASLFLSFHAYNNNPSTLGVIGFMQPATPFSAMAATWTGANWATGTFITRTNPNGSFDAFVGNGQAMTADMIVDVMGYFRAPQGTIGDITDVQTAAGSGLTGGVASGAVTLSLANGYKLPQSCASGQVPKSDGAGAWACAADATAGTVTNGWTQGGNAFGAPGVIATTDNQPLTVRAGGGQVSVLVGASGDGLRMVPLLSSTGTKRTLATINGSRLNSAFGLEGATIGGGGGELISVGADSPNTVTGHFGTIGGGYGNAASTQATVGGGIRNSASNAGVTIAGGNQNSAAGLYSTIGGGDTNSAAGFRGTVSGGWQNSASANGGVISGGLNNVASGLASTVGGGEFNTASGNYSFVAGGASNNVSGAASIIAGGRNNVVSANYSFAAGLRADIDQDHCAIFNMWIVDTRSNCAAQTGVFRVFANKGLTVDFGTPDAGGNGSDWVFIGPIFAGKSINSRSGAYLSTGGMWTNMSDRVSKEQFKKVDAQAILRKVAALPITTWNYIAEGKGVRRMGPMAQDFRKAFGLGMDEKSIGVVDADGVALAAIQGLNQKMDAKEVKIQSLERELASIKKKLGL
jgi:hypothetical protein